MKHRDAARRGQRPLQFLEALAMYRGLDDVNFYTVQCLKGLGTLYMQTCRNDQAEELLREAVDVYPVGHTDASLVMMQWNLAGLASCRHDGSASMAWARRSLASVCDLLAEDDPATARRLFEYSTRVLDESVDRPDWTGVHELFATVDDPRAGRWRAALGGAGLVRKRPVHR